MNSLWATGLNLEKKVLAIKGIRNAFLAAQPDTSPGDALKVGRDIQQSLLRSPEPVLVANFEDDQDEPLRAAVEALEEGDVAYAITDGSQPEPGADLDIEFEEEEDDDRFFDPAAIRVAFTLLATTNGNPNAAYQAAQAQQRVLRKRPEADLMEEVADVLLDAFSSE